MVQTVSDFEMFHVSRSTGHNHHPPLKMGQVLHIGQQLNPFHGYYETPPMYQVRMDGGAVQSLNPIYWLENVRSGHINPDNLPVSAHEIAKYFQTLSRETHHGIVSIGASARCSIPQSMPLGDR